LALALALSVLVAVRLVIVEPYAVTSGSMAPTLQVGDRLLVWRLGGVERGDVVVFHGSANWGEGGRDYVKRVIGVGGDEVRCCTAEGRIVRNGVEVDEPYLAGGGQGSTTYDVVVPEGRLWVLGDDRTESADSRAFLGRPGGGMVPVEDVVGKVRLRYWPLGRSQ